MSTHSFYQQINQQLEQTRQDGLFKNERIITSSQSADIAVLMVVMLLTFVPITT